MIDLVDQREREGAGNAASVEFEGEDLTVVCRFIGTAAVGIDIAGKKVARLTEDDALALRSQHRRIDQIG